MLIVMDGLGAAPKSPGNAVALSAPKNLSILWNTYPRTYLLASAEAVGLPANTKGNSEVGHLNIGSGRVINQNLPKINKSIQTGDYMRNNVLWDTLKHAIKSGGKVHLMGCLSDGSVHAHISHYIETVKFFSANNFAGELLIHAFTDGRDTPPDSARGYLQKLQEAINKYGTGRIATICGRSIAMDRMQKWDRTKQAYDLLTKGVGNKFDSWNDAITKHYADSLFDEFIPPTVIGDPEQAKISDGDSIIFMNFRADRAIQLTLSFVEQGFSHFEAFPFKNLLFTSMVEYRKGIPSHVLFPKEYINLPLGKVISSSGLRQLRISESEKFPHVTYFFNGGTSIKYQGEDRIEVPSPMVSTYDLMPEMSSQKMLDILSYRISTDMYDFIVVNFPNPDMVGHTGNLEASMKAIKTVDYCIAELVRKFTARGGSVIITADHGNVEEVTNLKTGEIDTEHSINPVPLIIVDPAVSARMLPYGALKDIAPTVLQIMGIPIPTEMTGRSLISST